MTPEHIARTRAAAEEKCPNCDYPFGKNPATTRCGSDGTFGLGHRCAYDDIQIVRLLSVCDKLAVGMSDRRAPAPMFSVEELLTATVLKGWPCRGQWAAYMWQLNRTERVDGSLGFVRELPEVRELHYAWGDRANVSHDNHQTFLVRLSTGLRLFVTFHDGMVYIGSRTRDGKEPRECL